jgi:branched-chain amino acid transport system substrate-binding protein
MAQFMEEPTDSLVFIQYGPSVPEFLELTKDKSTGVVYNLLGGPLLSPKNPRAEEVNAKYEAKYGSRPGVYGGALYEMAYIYFDALAKAGDPADHAAVAKAISETDKQTISGRLVFDQETHLARQGNEYIPIQFYQIWDGDRYLFYPNEYATGEFKQPTWMQ